MLLWECVPGSFPSFSVSRENMSRRAVPGCTTPRVCSDVCTFAEGLCLANSFLKLLVEIIKSGASSGATVPKPFAKSDFC